MFRSEKQAKLLRKLIMSSAFSEAEREATEEWLDTASCSRFRASVAIDRALSRIKETPKEERGIANRLDALTHKVAISLRKVEKPRAIPPASILFNP